MAFVRIIGNFVLGRFFQTLDKMRVSILVNQLVTKVYPQGYVHKSGNTRFYAYGISPAVCTFYDNYTGTFPIFTVSARLLQVFVHNFRAFVNIVLSSFIVYNGVITSGSGFKSNEL